MSNQRQTDRIVRDQKAESHHLLPSRQSAYRVNHSTKTAVIAEHDSIVRAIDSGEVYALVLLDLSSASDKVDHDTLLRVLTHRFGVNGPTLTWFCSFLTGRTQAYHQDDQQSQLYTLNCSVSQGSVLGPREFTAYTEELV